MQYRPNEYIGLAYLISDPADTGTYYVRAVMRDSRTNATIRTVNLTVDGSNSRRFYGEMQAPDVAVNQSRSVDITTIVYTDSGYTSESQVHAQIVNSYIIAERWNEAMGFGGSGGGISRRDVREVLTEMFPKLAGALPKPELKVETKEVNVEKTDLQPVLDKVASLATSVEKLAQDVAQVQEGLTGSRSEAKDGLGGVSGQIRDAAKDLDSTVRDLLKDMHSASRVDDVMGFMEKAEAAYDKFTQMLEDVKKAVDAQRNITISLKGTVDNEVAKPPEKKPEEPPMPTMDEFFGRAREKIKV